jgi:hypothetical protein
MTIKTKSAAPKGAKKPPTAKSEGTAPQDLTPLDVMLDVMRRYHAADEFAEALSAAKAAAPHFHAQRKNAERRDATDIESMSDDELDQHINELHAALGYTVVAAEARRGADRKDPSAGT